MRPGNGPGQLSVPEDAEKAGPTASTSCTSSATTGPCGCRTGPRPSGRPTTSAKALRTAPAPAATSVSASSERPALLEAASHVKKPLAPPSAVGPDQRCCGRSPMASTTPSHRPASRLRRRRANCPRLGEPAMAKRDRGGRPGLDSQRILWRIRIALAIATPGDSFRGKGDHTPNGDRTIAVLPEDSPLLEQSDERSDHSVREGESSDATGRAARSRSRGSACRLAVRLSYRDGLHGR